MASGATPAPSSASPQRLPGSGREVWRHRLAYLILIGPALLLYVGFMIVPAIMGGYYSLTDWNGWTADTRFVGLANYKDLAGDDRFWTAVRFTLFETVLIVAFFTFGSLILAVLLDRITGMKGLIRGLFFYPFVLSMLVSGLLFNYLANYREGAVNLLLRRLGLDAWTQDWMGNPDLVPYFIFALVAWSALGFFTTLYLANLQTVPVELYEAARIDGAGPVAVFTRIQFPLLLPTITTNSVLALITGINLFGQIVVTTEGGPGFRTVSISYYIYQLGVLSNRQGYASAVSMAVFFVLVVVACIQVSLMRKRTVAL
jgi:raffinose/stachyose/melibiose transport system permease protein